jgi:hypothetical protein
MKKDDMIKHLIEGGEFTTKELKKLKMDDIQELFDERFSVEFEDEDFSKGLEFGEDYVDDPTIERELMEKHGIDAEAELIRILEEELKKAGMEEEPEEEVIEIDLKSLSPVERRAYARTGVIPKINVNRYTRFDDETPKMDN